MSHIDQQIDSISLNFLQSQILNLLNTMNIHIPLQKFDLIRCIPKKNFQFDLTSIEQGTKKRGTDGSKTEDEEKASKSLNTSRFIANLSFVHLFMDAQHISHIRW